ncbi:MAG: PAC2 family protein [Bifidobacterium sp.]
MIQEVHHIDNEGFYDYQVARPMICSVQGRKRIIWPQTTFYDIAVSPRCIFSLRSPEPNYRWNTAGRRCASRRLRCERYRHRLDPCSTIAHTRPLPLQHSKMTAKANPTRI